MSATTDLGSVLASVALACDDEINRRHNRLAIIGIAVAFVLATVGIGLELWVINHAVSSFMDGFTSHLTPAPLHHAASTR